MEYVLTFVEGIASFISPCLLPMIPIYISYFIGFSITFMLLSIFASTLGGLISSNIQYIKIVFGVIIILLGFNYAEIIKLKFLNKSKVMKSNTKDLNFIKSVLFGIVFSMSWTPCIGTFLSSALLLIAKEQDLIKGIILMLMYSVGLGIPFVLSVILIERLKSTFDFIKKNYGIIKKVSGVILIITGLYIMFF